MEILNNIWVALTTPNESLTNTIIVFLGIFENFLGMFLFLEIFKIKCNKKQKITFVMAITLISTLSLLFVPRPFNVFINYIVYVILILYIFKLSILKSILATFLSSVILGLIGTLLSNPYLTLLNISPEEMFQTPIYELGFMLTTYVFVAFVILIIKYRNFTLNLLEDIDTKTRIAIFISVFLGFISLITQCLITAYYINSLPLLISFLSFISLIAYFCISIYTLTRIMKLTLTTRKLESAEAYNNSLRILHDNVRGFKHDFDNIVTTIGGYIKTEDIEGLKKYYLELEDDCQRVNNLYILNPEVVNNDGIYNLLTTKYNEADSKDIKVNLTFLLDLGNLHMKIYEFARILGILLDNAIEASSECEEKIINLSFRNDNKNSRELITIENTYNNKNVDIEKIFEKGISGKENHTGLGLWEVRKIIKKNNNINLHTSKTNKYFTQTLEIYY